MKSIEFIKQLNEAGGAPKEKMYPDTAKGVRAYIASHREMSKEYGADATIKADPHASGVWKVDNWTKGLRAIIYLAGYDGREWNDADRGEIPEQEMARYRSMHGISDTVNEDEFYPTKDDGGRAERNAQVWTEDEMWALQNNLVDLDGLQDYFIASLDFYPEDNRYVAKMKAYDPQEKRKYRTINFNIDTGGGTPFPTDVELDRLYGHSTFLGGFNDQEEFINEGWEADLAKKNRDRIKAERDQAKALARMNAPRKETAPKLDYDWVMMDIDSSIGNAFPDGDPIDELARNRKYKDRYGDFDMSILDRAVRATKQGKSYNDYVAKVWANHMQDNPGVAGYEHNPFNEDLEALNEMFGPMGGDQRNMRGSQPRIERPQGFTGSVTVTYPDFKDHALAKKYRVSVSDSGESGKNLTISGDKKDIKRFLIASGWASPDIAKWYPELKESTNGTKGIK